MNTEERADKREIRKIGSQLDTYQMFNLPLEMLFSCKAHRFANDFELEAMYRKTMIKQENHAIRVKLEGVDEFTAEEFFPESKKLYNKSWDKIKKSQHALLLNHHPAVDDQYRVEVAAGPFRSNAPLYLNFLFPNIEMVRKANAERKKA